jgi:predicted enzyme related to lactoylglutathione lyase
MLGDSAIMPTIPVSDMKRAKDFYEQKLGLEPSDKDGDGTTYQCGDGTALMIYESAGAGTSQATYASWEVDDLEAEMTALQANGVVFEDYDMPGLKTEDGVAAMGDYRAAWFKDSEGNILALSQMS